MMAVMIGFLREANRLSAFRPRSRDWRYGEDLLGGNKNRVKVRKPWFL